MFDNNLVVTSKKGKKKINLDTPLLPGRQYCQCHAQVHNLINNCLTCGRVICEQEGAGPCFFCGNDILAKGQRADFGQNEEEFPEFQDPNSDINKAIQHKNKMIEFDKSNFIQKNVFDEQTDWIIMKRLTYSKFKVLKKDFWKNRDVKEKNIKKNHNNLKYSIADDVWQDKKSRKQAMEQLVARNEEIQENDKYIHVQYDVRQGKWIENKPIFDEKKFKQKAQEFQAQIEQDDRDRSGSDSDDSGSGSDDGRSRRRKTNKAVKASANKTLKGDQQNLYDEIRQELQLIKEKSNQQQNEKKTQQKAQKKVDCEQQMKKLAKVVKTDEFEEFQREVQMQMMKEIESNDNQTFNGKNPYDEALYNMQLDDEGKCLSMLQPWASLLVEGFKRFEGRYWTTEYKGPLYIHAGATPPTQQQIDEIENQYKEHYKGVPNMPPFPKRYPTGCMIGCVDLQGVLTRDQYIANIPEKYREDSQCDHIFVVRNPRKLFYPIKMKGSKNIFDINDDIRINCKSQLIQVPSLWYDWVAKDIDIDLIQGKYDEEEEEGEEQKQQTEEDKFQTNYPTLGAQKKQSEEQQTVSLKKRRSNQKKDFMQSADIHTKMNKLSSEIKVKMEGFGFMLAPFLSNQEQIEIVDYIFQKSGGSYKIGITNVDSFQVDLNFPNFEKIQEFATKTYCYFTEGKKSECLNQLKNVEYFYLNQKQKRFAYKQDYFLIIMLGCDYEIIVQNNQTYKTKSVNVSNATVLMQLYDEHTSIIYENANINTKKQAKDINLKDTLTNLVICFKNWNKNKQKSYSNNQFPICQYYSKVSFKQSHIKAEEGQVRLFSKAYEPIDYESEMIVIEDNKLTIKDTSFKMNQSVALSGMQNEDQSFKFNKIYGQDITQDRLFGEIGAPSVEKVLQGINSLIISYGQTGSGKTFSIFGQHPEYLVDQQHSLEDQFSRAKQDQRGLIPKSIDYLLQKVIDLQDTKEIVISMSFAEIYLDKIRDIGKFYLLQEGGKKTLNIGKYIDIYRKQQQQASIIIKQQKNQKMKIQHYMKIQMDRLLLKIQLLFNLRVLISFMEYQNLVQIIFKNQQIEIKLLFQYWQFQIRDQMELKGISIWERAHTIFTINVIQKDKENENIPFSNCFIQFVDLAGSERIAKSLTEGHKYQESIIINQNLSALGKCLQAISLKGKTIPYKESKLTRIIQNSMQARSYISLIGNINPSESNYEECVSTLQFIERCSKDAPKMLPISSNNSQINNMSNSSVMNDKIIQKLQRENQEYKDKLEKVQQDHKKRLHDIQMLLGIDVELDKLFLKSSLKELNNIKQQKEAMIKVENLLKQNEELEKTIDNLHKHIEEIKRTEFKKWETQKCQIIELKEQLVNLKQQISSKEMNSKSDVKQFQKEKEQDLKNLIERSNALLEERNNLVFNLPTFVQNKTQDNQKVNDLKKATKYEAEKEHKSQVETLKKEYQQLLDNTKTQFEFFLKQKNDQIEEYVSDTKKYREDKKKQIDEMKLEMSEMYEILTRLSSILQKVELGHYSGGIKSVNIPEKEKPSLPVRQKYKHLFKVLDLKHLRQGSMRQSDLLLKKSVSQISQLEMKKMKSATSQGEDDQVKDDIDNEKQMQNEKDLKEQENNRIDITINLNQFKNKDDFIHIKNYAERLKNSLQKSLLREKELQQRVDDFQKINNNIDITALLKEKDEYKSLYQQQLKKYNQARIVLESQKRLLNMPKYNQSMQIQIRPSTASNHAKSLLRLPMTTANKNQQ